MNALHKAFQVLGLEPGTAFPQVKKRYRRLVIVWHPDRMNSDDARREAEEELKKINDAFEKLKKHFDTQHVAGTGCSCQPGAARDTSASRSNTEQRSSQTGSSRAKEWEKAKKEAEAAAKKRSDDRARQQAEEHVRRAAEQAAKRASEFQTTVNEALNNEALWKEERIRWKIALGLLIVFLGLIGFCWLGCGARALASNIETHWKEIFDSSQRKAPKEEQREQPRTIRIYNEYCPHHHNHGQQIRLKEQRPSTSDSSFSGSQAWNRRVKAEKALKLNSNIREIDGVADKYSSPFAPPSPPPR